jgi:hypothetical protein
MWIPLLVMAAAVSLEPFRVGMAILMLNRPRPLLHLLTFLAGGFAMGLTVGVTVLFVLRPVLRSAHFTLPRVQLVVGALVLALAAVVYTSAATGLGRPIPDREPGRFEARIRLMAGNHSPWTSGVAGLGIALPSVDYLAALTLIVASGAAASTQFGALLLFNVVAFGLVEMPLISYLVAPDRTRAALAVLHNWLQTERRRRVAALMAIVGAVLLLAGFAGL